LQVELDRAEADRLRAHNCYVAHSDFYSDLMILFYGFDDDGMLGAPVPADVRELVCETIRQNQPALLLHVGEVWRDKLTKNIQALQSPITWGSLLPAVSSWIDVLARQTGTDLQNRGQAKIRLDALRLRLPQLRSDCSAARFAVLALDVLSRRRPAELLPAEQLPAERLPARLPADLLSAEARPAVPLPSDSSPAGPSLCRPAVAADLPAAGKRCQA